MSNLLQIQSYENESQAIESAGQALVLALKTGLTSPQKVLLLLAGGSATKVYEYVAKNLADLDLHNLSLAIEDERWPEKNNTTDVKKSGLIEATNKLGATFYELPDSENMTEAASAFHTWLKTQLDSQIITFVGIGDDGHLLSVNADQNQSRFNELFQSPDLVTAYHADATTALFSEFPDRITLTLTGLQKSHQVFGLVLGEKKQSVLKDLKTKDLPLNLQPAQSLKHLKTTLFTDQSI